MGTKLPHRDNLLNYALSVLKCAHHIILYDSHDSVDSLRCWFVDVSFLHLCGSPGLILSKLQSPILHLSRTFKMESMGSMTTSMPPTSTASGTMASSAGGMQGMEMGCKISVSCLHDMLATQPNLNTRCCGTGTRLTPVCSSSSTSPPSNCD